MVGTVLEVRWWEYIVLVCAWMGPASHVPSLTRLVRYRTCDGMTPQLCGVATLSYGAWGGLVVGLRGTMIAVFAVGAALSTVTFFYVLRWSRTSLWYLSYWLVPALLCGVVANRWVVVGLLVVGPIDLAWYVRAIKDLRGSKEGRAVSSWGWSMSFIAAVAWAVEGYHAGKWAVQVQSGAIAVAAALAGATTVVVHRRRGWP